MSAEAIPTMAGRISELFTNLGKTWKIGGEQSVPSPDDVAAVLAKAKWEVDYQAANSHLKNTSPQIEMRHLMFKLNEAGNVEVYVKMGEIE